MQVGNHIRRARTGQNKPRRAPRNGPPAQRVYVTEDAVAGMAHPGPVVTAELRLWGAVLEQSIADYVGIARYQRRGGKLPPGIKPEHVSREFFNASHFIFQSPVAETVIDAHKMNADALRECVRRASGDATQRIGSAKRRVPRIGVSA